MPPKVPDTAKRLRISKENVARFFGGVTGTWAIVGCIENCNKVDERVKIRRAQIVDMSKFKLNVLDLIHYEEESTGPGNYAKKLKIVEVLPNSEEFDAVYGNPKSDCYSGTEPISVCIEARIGPQGFSMKYRVTPVKVKTAKFAVEVSTLLVATNVTQLPKIVGEHILTGSVISPPLAEGWPATISLNAWPGSTILSKTDEATGALLPSEGTLVFCCGVKPLAKTGEYTVCDSTGASGYWFSMFYGIFDGTKWEISQLNCNTTVNKLHPQELIGHFVVIREKMQKSSQKTYIGNVSLCVDYPDMLPTPDDDRRCPVISVLEAPAGTAVFEEDETDWLKSPTGRDSAVLKHAGEAGEWGELPAIGWMNCTVMLDGLYKANRAVRDKCVGSKVSGFVYLRGKHKYDGPLNDARQLRLNDVRNLFSSPDASAEVYPHYMEVTVTLQGLSVTAKNTSAIALKQQQIQNLSFLLKKYGAKLPDE